VLRRVVHLFHYARLGYTLTKMEEPQIRQIVRDEFEKNYRAGAPQVPPHNHDSVNNLRIKESDLIHSIGVMGNIDFASNSTYTLYFTSPNPSRLDLNGFVFDTGVADSSALIVGVGILSSAYYFQPDTTRSARQGGLQYPLNGILAQCSSNLYVEDGGNNTFPHASEVYIMNAFTAAGARLVTGQLKNLTDTSIDIQITNLAVGWRVSANIVIT